MKISIKILILLGLAQFLQQPLQAQRRPTGLVDDLPAYRAIPKKIPLTAGSYNNLPEKVSLEQFCPTPGDQGQTSTCVAFATAYHLRTLLYAREHGLKSKSDIDNNIFSPSFVYEQIKNEDDYDCMQGSNPVKALELMKSSGVSTLNSLPFSCGVPLSGSIFAEASNYPITDYLPLFMPDNEDRELKVNATKKALSEGLPVVLGFLVAESFYKAGRVWRASDTDDGPTGQHGRHAMLVVGYDESVEGGAFRVINSWGTNWGDRGYVWIPYDAYADYAIWGLQVYGGNTPEPQPEPEVKPEPDVKPDPVKPEPDPVKPDPVKPEPLSVSLEGKVEFRLNNGSAMPANRVLTRNLVVAEANDEKPYKEELVAYRMDNAYASGTKFRFYITTNTESYIYAFATDAATQKVNKILPFDDSYSSHIGPNSTVAFPSESKVVKMDNQPGTDYMLILYSREKLDANDMLSKMNGTQGGLSEKIHAALGNKLILPSEITYKTNQIGFDVKGEGKGTVVPLMVEITHQ